MVFFSKVLYIILQLFEVEGSYFRKSNQLALIFMGIQPFQRSIHLDSILFKNLLFNSIVKHWDSITPQLKVKLKQIQRKGPVMLILIFKVSSRYADNFFGIFRTCQSSGLLGFYQAIIVIFFEWSAELLRDTNYQPSLGNMIN